MPVYRFEDLREVQHNPGLSSSRGQTIKGERIFFGRRTKKAGTGSKPHHHPSEQFLYLLRGRLRVHIENQEEVVGPGGVIHIPAEVVHQTFAEGDEDAEYIYVKDTSWGLTGLAEGQMAPEKPPEDKPY